MSQVTGGTSEPTCVALTRRDVVHLKVVVKDLKNFLDVRDIARLKLGPDRNIWGGQSNVSDSEVL